MFGYDLKQIAQGHVNEILNKESELYNTRMPICKECPLFTDKSVIGPVCDASKFYNPQTGEIKKLPSKGFIEGCGCRLEAKVRVKQAKCVLGKWPI